MQVVTISRTRAASAPSQECRKSGLTAWWEGRAGYLTLKDVRILTAARVQGGLFRSEQRGGEGRCWVCMGTQTGDLC